MPKFDEEENIQIDKEIKELITNMTLKVKRAEGNIKKLSKMNLPSESEEEIKNNIKINLAEKIKNFTHEFKQNEQKYVKNYKELVGDISEDDEKNKFNYSKNSNEGFLNIHADNQLQRRDEEISTLLNSINQLATTFQDLQVIVQEQGTILDRIDYNIDTTVDNVEKANKNLKEANKKMKRNCFRNATMILLSVIFVESVILLFRFT
jgi:syntaxin 16